MNKTTIEPKKAIYYKLLFLQIIVLWCSIFVGRTQNLIPNPSFEKFNKCPTRFTINHTDFNEIIEHWFTANIGTPDYFNRNCVGDAGVPYNYTGFAEAKHGDAYIGLYIVDNYTSNYREYVEVELLQPLKPGHLYEIGFWVLFATNSPYFTEELQVALTNEQIFDGGDSYLSFNPQLNFELRYSNIFQVHSWKYVKSKYKALGGERYLIVGNFKSNKETKYHKTNGHSSQNIAFKERGYVLLDNFSLQDENTEATHIQQSSKDTARQNLVFDHLAYDFDQAKYNQNAIPMLELILDSLKNNPNLKIEIYGHTDSVGTIEYNQQLSEMRAKNISEYLFMNGIEKKRINYKGFGFSRPIDSTNNENNRRVEIKIYK